MHHRPWTPQDRESASRTFHLVFNLNWNRWVFAELKLRRSIVKQEFDGRKPINKLSIIPSNRTLKQAAHLYHVCSSFNCCITELCMNIIQMKKSCRLWRSNKMIPSMIWHFCSESFLPVDCLLSLGGLCLLLVIAGGGFCRSCSNTDEWDGSRNWAEGWCFCPVQKLYGRAELKQRRSLTWKDQFSEGENLWGGTDQVKATWKHWQDVMRWTNHRAGNTEEGETTGEMLQDKTLQKMFFFFKQTWAPKSFCQFDKGGALDLYLISAM